MKKSKENIIYGKNLQKIRLDNNLTQEQVSQITGLETKYISQIECGIAKGTIDTMLKFCKAYHVTPNDVLNVFITETENNDECSELNQKFLRLNKRDKKVVLLLIDNLLED